MRVDVRIGIACVIALGFAAHDAAAQVYKCRDSKGNLTYLDRPCPEAEKAEEAPPIDAAPTVYPDDAPPRTGGGKTTSRKERPKSVCDALGDGSTPDENVINCARSRGLPYGPTWAMTTPWKDAGDGVTTAQGYCLATSVSNFDGKTYSLRTSLFFVDDFRMLKRGRERYSVNGLSAGAIDDGAAKACEVSAKFRR